MKKLLLVLATALLAIPACADWSVTVTWTRSPGPNLASEQVFYGADQKCSVLSTAPTTCQFNTPTLGGSVVVRSINAQGAYSETAPILVSDVPAPASGVLKALTLPLLRPRSA